jgi:hypothetical protein
MDAEHVMGWVAGYELAWRDGDLAAVERLFTDDAHYRPSPYEEAEVGHGAIKALWLDDDDQVFTVHAQPVAVEGRNAVVRLDVCYVDPIHQQYRDLWVLRFADDGRVEDFRGMGLLAGQAVLRDRALSPLHTSSGTDEKPSTRGTAAAVYGLPGLGASPEHPRRDAH